MAHSRAATSLYCQPDFQQSAQIWPPAGYNCQRDYFSILERCAIQGQYANLVDLIMIQNDRIEGIQSYIAKNPTLYPTGYALVRDARQTSSDQSLSPDNHITESNNMLLRVFSTMRAIDFVLGKIGSIDLQEQLKRKALGLIAETKTFQETRLHQKSISDYEVEFNAALKEILQKAGLADEMKSDKDFEMLLAHYRNLASTLDPAKSMVSIQQYPGGYTHVESAHPITVKTHKQKAQLAVMHSYAPADTETNFHNVKKRAIRIASAHFCDQIMRDETRLPAQARRTMGPTIKNGYIVHNLLLTADGVAITEQWLARSSSPTYVGNGESERKLIAYAKESMRQIQEHIHRLRYLHNASTRPIRAVKLHVLSLLTDSSFESQDLMISCTKKALVELDEEFSGTQAITFEWSNIPTNLIGLAHPSEISPLVRDLAMTADRIAPGAGRDIGNRAERAKKAAEAIRIIDTDLDTTNVVSCASGLDRSGTAVEIATELWLQETLGRLQPTLSLGEIQKIRILACHNAILATLAAPGSPGMKNCSKPGDFFPPEVNARFYRESADSNKAAPILRQTAKQAMKRAFDEAEKALQDTNEKDPLSVIEEWIEKVMLYQNTKEEISKTQIAIKQLGRLFNKGLNAVPRTTVNEILGGFQVGINGATESGLPAVIATARQQIDTAKRLAKTGGTVLDQLERLLTLMEKRPGLTATATAAASAQHTP
ncbi:MAG: hypothetical protein A3E84_01035 [Gammaproteobacteria bacterium RIFCSPHIGHO2_12_FULL_42_13]|nr:MAG: hypothetical protein A3E84_01035 [Gammaproteobacteria bacterium RIFCSPHIGHO2_12_FULL_42_13]